MINHIEVTAKVRIQSQIMNSSSNRSPIKTLIKSIVSVKASGVGLHKL